MSVMRGPEGVPFNEIVVQSVVNAARLVGIERVHRVHAEQHSETLARSKQKAPSEPRASAISRGTSALSDARKAPEPE